MTPRRAAALRRQRLLLVLRTRAAERGRPSTPAPSPGEQGSRGGQRAR